MPKSFVALFFALAYTASPAWAGHNGVAADPARAQQVVLEYARAHGWHVEVGPGAPPIKQPLGYKNTAQNDATVEYDAGGLLTETVLTASAYLYRIGAWGVNPSGQRCRALAGAADAVIFHVECWDRWPGVQVGKTTMVGNSGQMPPTTTSPSYQRNPSATETYQYRRAGE